MLTLGVNLYPFQTIVIVFISLNIKPQVAF